MAFLAIVRQRVVDYSPILAASHVSGVFVFCRAFFVFVDVGLFRSVLGAHDAARFSSGVLFLCGCWQLSSLEARSGDAGALFARGRSIQRPLAIPRHTGSNALLQRLRPK